MIQEHISVKQKTGLIEVAHKLSNHRKAPQIAFLVYLAMFLAPNGSLFIIKISEGFHLTPIRSVLLIIGIITALNILSGRLNIFSILRKFSLFFPLIILLTIKITSLLYSYNYLRGIGVIEWLIENIFFAAVCYIYYVKGIIDPSKIFLFIVIGFILSILVSLIQIVNNGFNFNFLLPIIDYVRANTPDANLFSITGLYIGDTNCYATYIATVILVLFGVLLYTKKYLLRTIILLSLGIAVLFSTQSRSTIIILIFIFIYMIIREHVNITKKVKSIMLIFAIILFIIVAMPSNIKNVFFEKYSARYQRMINYINSVDNMEESNLKAHKDMIMMYFEHIKREPLALIIGVGEGDYLGRGGGGEKGGTGAHNAYVLILGENGPVAFLIFVYITWLIIKTSYFVNRKSTKPFAKSLLYYNIAYLLSFVLYGSQINEYIFWGLIGITFAEKNRIVTNMRNRSGKSTA